MVTKSHVDAMQTNGATDNNVAQNDEQNFKFVCTIVSFHIGCHFSQHTCPQRWQKLFWINYNILVSEFIQLIDFPYSHTTKNKVCLFKSFQNFPAPFIYIKTTFLAPACSLSTFLLYIFLPPFFSSDWSELNVPGFSESNKSHRSPWSRSLTWPIVGCHLLFHNINTF